MPTTRDTRWATLQKILRTETRGASVDSFEAATDEAALIGCEEGVLSQQSLLLDGGPPRWFTESLHIPHSLFTESLHIPHSLFSSCSAAHCLWDGISLSERKLANSSASGREDEMYTPRGMFSTLATVLLFPQ